MLLTILYRRVDELGHEGHLLRLSWIAHKRFPWRFLIVVIP